MRGTLATLLVVLPTLSACAEAPTPFPGETRAECIESADWLYDANIDAGMSPVEAADRRSFQVNAICANMP